MSSTIAPHPELIKHLMELLQAHRGIFGQARVCQRVVALVLGEVMAFARHTVTQLLMVLGLNEADWSGWYRLFSAGRFDEGRAAEVLLTETLAHVPAQGVYMVAGDGTQVPRTSRTMEGSRWLHHPQTPVFKRGIHRAQRWFNLSWLLPDEQGYSRALPLRFVPAFPDKAVRQAHEARTEWQAALDGLRWLRVGLDGRGRDQQVALLLADGSFDTLPLWAGLPDRVVLLARTASGRMGGGAMATRLPDRTPTCTSVRAGAACA
jgi:hypothetical protein